MNQERFWLVVGSQLLYGPEVLETVEQNAKEMVQSMNRSLPFEIEYRGTVKSSADANEMIRQANQAPECAGVITWCHTFSPSKLWVQALQNLQKPWCHFATQHHKMIPNDSIDMDFMNLNQAAHGDREHGFIGMRLQKPRKIVVGHWQDAETIAELGAWMRVAVAAKFSSELRILRFGDNMRDVAVTDGDKIETLLRLGWQVDYWPVGHLVETMQQIGEDAIDAKMQEYAARYELATDDLETVRYQARIELAMREILQRENAHAVVTNFQDLYGLKQLPGLAIQNLMADGYGFGAEGDWKTAGLTALVKKMGGDLVGGTSFVEDYSYDYGEDDDLELAAHMLEICPTMSEEKAKIEVHPLGIGDREAPARLVFSAKPGDGVVASLVDVGGRMRLLLQQVKCVKAPLMPKLPVARIMWKPAPNLKLSLHCWLLAGGGHHSVLSTQVQMQMLEDWAELMQIEVLRMDENTTLDAFKERLMISEIYWKLR